MNLRDCISGFDGILVIADLHGDIESLVKARHYAKNHNLFFLSLGDLVDRGPFPFETVKEMLNIVESESGAMTYGNHDDKHYRHAIGNKVNFSGDAVRTMHAVGEERTPEFFEIYKKLYAHERTALYHYIDNFVFAHASCHPSMWQYPAQLSSEAKSRALYGEVTGKYGSDGKPERVYNWINEIPEGHYIIVGHDRTAIHDVKLVTPLVVTNGHKGTAIFSDTGCGKGGFLSGVVLKVNETTTELDKFIHFE